MSLRQSLSNTLRDKRRMQGSYSDVSITSPTPAKSRAVGATSGSPAVSTVSPMQSSGGTGMGKAAATMSKDASAGMGKGMGAKNGVGFPKKASMASGANGIKGPTKLGKSARGVKY